jgi:hypothetical protein
MLTEEISAPPEDVRDFYVDLDNLRLIHPLVVSVRTIQRAPERDGYRQTYRVRDRIRFGPLTIPVGYTARIHVPVAGEVTSDARQFPFVRVNSMVRFDAIAGGTRVVEHIRIEAPRLLAGFTTREAVKAHTAMWTNVRHRFA